ncbi:hypothetical protein Q31b_17460 [Novipirellula aureliae]|uniref:Uncharacterized protein n=1 Tax=Novipirellula aureliae TaxID=2527966 RepID=A0A5C6E5V8_9BACT|nr:putative glycoside hydrolase [Novipirellula aureliae]TWU44210.1 hypothetical protein Q31b_17460 [Novipirellula aureliae]
MKNQGLFGVCISMLIIGLAQAADDSGRNSHFWITLRPQAGTTSGNDTDLVLANGYRRVDLGSSDLSCERVDNGSNRVYQISWTGNSFLGDGGAETLQFNAVVDFNGAVSTLENVTVDGVDLSAHGLVLQELDSRVADGNLRLNFVVRNPALTVEDPDHAFADLPDGHTYGPTPYQPTTQAKLERAFPKFSWDRVPRTMLIRKPTPFTAEQYKRVANRYDIVVLEKANGGMPGYWEKATSLKKVNPDIKVLYYWNSRIYFGHNGVDDSIEDKRDEYIDPDFVIRGRLPTFQRENPELVAWWAGVCHKMMGLVEGVAADGVTPFQDFENWEHGSPIDGYFIDKKGVPISMLKPLYDGSTDDKFGMNNNGDNRDRIPYLDGTYREGWAGGATAIANAIALAQESGRNQKLTMLRNPVHNATDKRNVEDRVDENLAIYLTYAEKYAYFYWAPTVDASQPDWMWITDYVDQFNRPLGKPFGDAIKDNWIYCRGFEHCDVFFNLKPDSGSTVSRVYWKNDIGSPALDGSGFSKTDDTYTLQGSGHLSGVSDKFFYLSDLHYGDGKLAAKLEALDDSHAGARSGIMFRERNEPMTTELDFAEDYTAAYRDGTVLLPDARTVAVLRDPSGQMHMVYRSTTAGELRSAGTLPPAQGPYATLTRIGDTFTGYASADGETWTKIAQVDLSLAEKVEAGMVVCSGDDNSLAEATFRAFSREESTPDAAFPKRPPVRRALER